MSIILNLIENRLANANTALQATLTAFRTSLLNNSEIDDQLEKTIIDLINKEAGRDDFIQAFSAILNAQDGVGADIGTLPQAIRNLYPNLGDNAGVPPSIPLYHFIRDNIGHLQAISLDGRDGNYAVQKRRGPTGGFILTKESDPQVNSNPPAEIEGNSIAVIDNDGSNNSAEVKEALSEFNFYQRVKDWAENNDYKLTEIIGGQITGRKWENPDLIEIYSEYNSSMLQLDFYITSFEVKLELSIDAIWQASNYQKFSHYVYLAIASEDFNENDDSNLKLIDTAVTAGLGILVLKNNQFTRINYPRRNEPTARDLNELIGRYFNRSFRQNIFERPKSRYAAEKKNLQAELLNGGEVSIQAVFGLR